MARTSKPKYRTKGLGKNKEIKEERKKPIPLSIMTNHKDNIYVTENL